MRPLLLGNGVLDKTLSRAVGAVLLDASTNVSEWPSALWDHQACLLVHINLSPRRSQRRGLELVDQLRWEWGMTAPVLFVSFEAEETLRATPHGAVLAKPGHGFLRLPTTVVEIREALEGVPPVVDPERYRRSAVAAAVRRLLDGPLSGWKTALADSKRAFDWWRNGVYDRDKVRERLADTWWREWQTGIATCQDQLAHWPQEAANAQSLLFELGQHFELFVKGAQQVLDDRCPDPTSQELSETITRLDALAETLKVLHGLRVEERRP